MTITSFSRGDTWATGYPQGFSYSQYTLHPCDSERINGVGSALESFCFHTPHSDAAIIQTTKGGLII
jgi:hypothetical protein